MASGGGGVGRGRGRGAGGGAQLPTLGAGIAARECESCRATPGIPFCRVEWSFLCAGCASVVHGQSWIVAVPPTGTTFGSNLSPVSGAYAAPYAYQHPFPPNPSPNPSAAAPLPNPPPNSNPNPNPNPSPTPSSNPNHIVQLSSDEGEQSAGDPGDDDDGIGGRKRRRPSSEGESAGREASVMRYKEKRKNRNFDKTIRYESRRAHAEMKPRVGGKFVKSADDVSGEVDDGASAEQEGVAVGGELDRGGDAIVRDSSEEARTNTVTELGDPIKLLKPLDPGEMVSTSLSFEVEQFGGVEIDAAEEVGLL
ncbi:zinc finger CCCH domain-containing protein 4-like [Zingiber officinale]|uniref:zinc finger CCCH domain-containing protein 4-like n=1 Tax=Zingiber officinale TaxID=94328 RepID=UPI001C4CE115|nr:zinc finger CCCH domain-containing protein 4-like [Zingiber officinale]